jgi:hypothetical protein
MSRKESRKRLIGSLRAAPENCLVKKITFVTTRNTLLNKLDADDTINPALLNGRKRQEVLNRKFCHLTPLSRKQTRTLY